MDVLGNFCINDRPIYAAALKEKVNFLDFSVEEVHRLRPVIKWLGLNERYLSNVAEKTSVDESQGIEDPVLAHDLASKSAALAMFVTQLLNQSQSACSQANKTK
jgi:hypothetical protein